jgi:hypothetical protein
MIVKVERKQDQVLLWDGYGTPPIILSHDEAFDLASKLLEMCGRMGQEVDSEEAVA